MLACAYSAPDLEGSSEPTPDGHASAPRRLPNPNCSKLKAHPRWISPAEKGGWLEGWPRPMRRPLSAVRFVALGSATGCSPWQRIPARLTLIRRPTQFHNCPQKLSAHV